MGHLAGKTLFITGGSRGIGLAIALRAARDGANVAIASGEIAIIDRRSPLSTLQVRKPLGAQTERQKARAATFITPNTTSPARTPS